MMRPDAKVEKVYLYPKPVDFRKSIDGLTALVELDIKVAVFDPVLCDCADGPGAELVAGRYRPVAQPAAPGSDATIRGLNRYNPRHDFHARNPS